MRFSTSRMVIIPQSAPSPGSTSTLVMPCWCIRCIASITFSPGAIEITLRVITSLTLKGRWRSTVGEGLDMLFASDWR